MTHAGAPAGPPAHEGPGSAAESAQRDWAATLRADLGSGVVAFLVALPLCLGIAQASGAPLLSGMIAGVAGGLLVTAISTSPLSVSGPAAGLAVIVAGGIGALGLRAFLVSVVLAGALQVVMGLLRLGTIAHYFPNSVIRGMLAAIGLLLIGKQLPLTVGADGALRELLSGAPVAWPAVVVSAACVAVHLGWPRVQRLTPALKPIPSALLMAAAGAAVVGAWPGEALAPRHFVGLPRFSDLPSVAQAIVTPDFAQLSSVPVWTMAVTLALVASIETLLSLEAVDRIDPLRRISPPNRELVAQGVANVGSALLGGLPVTSVIVRSSANVMAGARTRNSARVHGLLLLLSVLALAPVLNRVPLAALAVVLVIVGLKLTPWSLWRAMWGAGASEFVPFAVTVGAVIALDLLRGTLIGLVVGLGFAVRAQQRNAIVTTSEPGKTVIRFTKDLTFLQKARLKEVLRGIPDGTEVTIDRSVCDFIDDDIEELLLEFSDFSKARGITVHEALTSAVVAKRARLRPAS